jgi:hypothetical protein
VTGLAIETNSNKKQQFLSLYDRKLQKLKFIRMITTESCITCVEYGPYDNGHVVCGFESGELIVYSAIDLTKLLVLPLFN